MDFQDLNNLHVNNRIQANKIGAVIKMQDETEIKLRHMIGHLNAATRLSKDIYKERYQSEFSGPWDVDDYLDGLGPDFTKTSNHDSRPRNEI